MPKSARDSIKGQAVVTRKLFWRGTVFTFIVLTAFVATPAQPVSADTATAVSSGSQHTCAVTTSGGLKCWGSNDDGQLGDGTTTDRSTPVDVAGLTSGVIAVSTGKFHSCALTTTGGLRCWGSNSRGQLGDSTFTSRSTPVDVTGLSSGVAAVSSGNDYTCAVTTAGGLKCWGRNSYGQLGDGTNIPRSSPVDVTGLTSQVATVSSGNVHACAVTTTGGVKCWGRNSHGQLGDGTVTNRVMPVDVSGLTAGVAGVSAGGSHTCAVSTSGGLKCWGSYRISYRTTPTDVDGLTTGVAAVAGGWQHICALTLSGGLECWGSNLYGQLGDGTTTDGATPTEVFGLATGVAAVSLGTYHTCALMVSGGVKCWGWNNAGQLGDGTPPHSATSTDVVGLTDSVAAISLGHEHSCAVTLSGGLKCWGRNSNGQLGDGTTTDRTRPVDVAGLTSGVATVSLGHNHTCSSTTSGGARCWGRNSEGQLGDGSTANQIMPVDVAGLTNGVIAVSSGAGHTCAVTNESSLKCWGFNLYGQLGDGTNVDRTTPVDVAGLTSRLASVSLGGSHTCSVSISGRLKCWGFNSSGQLGDGTNTDRSTPVDVARLTTSTVSVSAGDFNTCAVTKTGSLRCWGSNRNTPEEVAGFTGNVTYVSPVAQHTCAVTTTGGLRCWGRNNLGQLGDGTTTDSNTPVDVVGLTGRVAAVSAGSWHTCALTTSGTVKCWGDNSYGQLGNGTPTHQTTPTDVDGFGAVPAPAATQSPTPTSAAGTPDASAPEATPRPSGGMCGSGANGAAGARGDMLLLLSPLVLIAGYRKLT